MKKANLLLICLFITSLSFSQKNINGLINAEKAFASFTLAHSIKEGFLNYMDSAGVVFREGKAVNALEAFGRQKAGPGVLTWGPSFVVISVSGNMGVTAGPYEFREKDIKDTAVNKGTFSSIWQINQNGEWKNMADLGVSYKTDPPNIRSVEKIKLKEREKVAFGFDDVFGIDQKLNTAIQQQDKKAWQKYLAPESHLNIEGQVPYQGIEAINAALTSLPAGMVLQSVTGGISTSKDFAYIYGTVLVGDKKDNYLRAWIYRNRQWQVILQTIKW